MIFHHWATPFKIQIVRCFIYSIYLIKILWKSGNSCQSASCQLLGFSDPANNCGLQHFFHHHYLKNCKIKNLELHHEAMRWKWLPRDSFCNQILAFWRKIPGKNGNYIFLIVIGNNALSSKAGALFYQCYVVTNVSFTTFLRFITQIRIWKHLKIISKLALEF